MILCCTKKVLDKLKKYQSVENVKTEIDLYTWYVDLITIKRKNYFLCVHAQSITVFLFYAGTKKEYSNIEQLFEENMKAFFAQEIGRSAQQFTKLFPKDEPMRFVKTNSRSVLGHMRDMKVTLDYYTDKFLENRLPEVTHSLNKMIRSVKGGEYFTPKERLREIIGYDESDKNEDLEGGRPKAKNRLTFKISLGLFLEEDNVEVEIWRRVSVSDNTRFDRFHQVIQLAMGWKNCHLHDFRIGSREIGIKSKGDWEGTFDHVEDETIVYLNDFEWKEQDTFRYVYDYGDYWDHTITLEKIEPSTEELPELLAGAEACPIENIGGTMGYINFKEAYANPESDYYDFFFPDGHDDFEMPEFSLEDHQAILKEFGKWCEKNPWSRSTPWHEV